MNIPNETTERKYKITYPDFTTGRVSLLELVIMSWDKTIVVVDDGAMGEFIMLDDSDFDYVRDPGDDDNTYPSVHDATDVYANTIEGRYITFTWLPDGNMRLDLTPEGREEAEYQIGQANNKRLSDDIFFDLIEDLRANGYITLDPDDDGRNTIILGAWDFTPEEYEPRNDAAYWRDLNSAPYWYDDRYVYRLLLDDLILFYDDPREEADAQRGYNRKFPVVLRRGATPLLYLADSED